MTNINSTGKHNFMDNPTIIRVEGGYQRSYGRRGGYSSNSYPTLYQSGGAQSSYSGADDAYGQSEYGTIEGSVLD